MKWWWTTTRMNIQPQSSCSDLDSHIHVFKATMLRVSTINEVQSEGGEKRWTRDVVCFHKFRTLLQTRSVNCFGLGVFFFRVVLVSWMCAGLFGLCSGFAVSFVCSGYQVVFVFRLFAVSSSVGLTPEARCIQDRTRASLLSTPQGKTCGDHRKVDVGEFEDP